MTGGDFIVERLPIRCEADEFHSDKKLFAKGFLSGVAPVVIHDGRKLFANGFLSGVAPMAFHSSRKLFTKGFLFGVTVM